MRRRLVSKEGFKRSSRQVQGAFRSTIIGKWVGKLKFIRESAGTQALSRMVCDTLHFGMAGRGGEVSEEQWEEFLKTVVTPRFPAGFTVYDSHGQWLGKDGQVLRERAKVLQIVHRPGTKHEKALGKIIEAYKTAFGQESVLRVRSSVQVSF
ncbi:MAG: DUF3574 domain-containing protein [Desulfobacteraceae bacterium]|nr:DUF3574 domain-containing protein [Desulfobacteraceae bacterium]